MNQPLNGLLDEIWHSYACREFVCGQADTPRDGEERDQEILRPGSAFRENEPWMLSERYRRDDACRQGADHPPVFLPDFRRIRAEHQRKTPRLQPGADAQRPGCPRHHRKGADRSLEASYFRHYAGRTPRDRFSGGEDRRRGRAARRGKLRMILKKQKKLKVE